MDLVVRDSLCLHEFAQRVQPLLERDEVSNNLPLGILRALLQGNSSLDEAPLCWTVEEVASSGAGPSSGTMDRFLADHEGSAGEEASRIHLILLRTPPHHVIVTAPQLALVETEMQARAEVLAQEAMRRAAKVLFGDGVQFPGVIALRPTGDQFAEIWCSEAGLTAELEMEQRIYGLKTLNDVPLVPGAMRLAQGSDAPLLIQWQQEFIEEAMPNEPAIDYARTIMRLLDNQAIFVWEVDGEVRSMAAKSRRTDRGIVVSDVYTPKNYRGRGYATALVHDLSALLLQSYEYCSLYTDLGNPTSNSIYAKIGYEPVCDSVVYRFVEEGSAG